MYWLSYDRLMAVGAVVLACGLAWLGYVWAKSGSITPGITIAGIGVVVFVVGLLKRENTNERKKSERLPEEAKRIGYDIDDNVKLHTRNARIRRQDVAFKLRGNARLRDENSDIG